MIDLQAVQEAAQQTTSNSWTWPAVAVLAIGQIGIWIDKVMTVQRARQARQAGERAEQKTQSQAPTNRNGNGKIIDHEKRITLLEGETKNLCSQFETMRKENREDHGKIFDLLQGK